VRTLVTKGVAAVRWWPLPRPPRAQRRGRNGRSPRAGV